MKNLAIISALATIMLGGCLFPSAPAEESSVLMPLKVGNMWIGDRTRTTPSGSTTVRDTLVITGERMIDGETWFVANNGTRYINRSTGLYMQSDQGSCDCFTAKYPSAAGDSIALPDALVLLPGGTEPVTQTVVQRVVTTDTTIQVSAGTFSTYHFRMEVVRPANARLTKPSSRFRACRRRCCRPPPSP